MATTEEQAGPANPLSAVGGFAQRLRATVNNGFEWVRYGGLQTDEESSPYEVLGQHRTYRLRRYFTRQIPGGSLPVILVPPLMMTAEVWDVSHETSAVQALHSAGIDTWVVDFGRPDKEPGGLHRTLTDHVIAVSRAVDEVREITGREVVLAGYSQGGMFAYQAAAYRRCEGIDSLVTFGSPVDTRAPLPVPISPESFARLAQRWLDTGLANKVSMPGWMTRTGFKMLDPVKTVRNRVDFLMQLHDREALLPRERQRRFLDSEGFTAYSGPAIAELLEQFVSHNRMVEGGFIIGDRLVTLADIDRPILTFVGETDAIGHPQSVRAIRKAAPRATVYEVTLQTGHFGLVVGSSASRLTWPNVAGWVHWREDKSQLPSAIVPAEKVQSTLVPTVSALTQRLQKANDFWLGVARTAIDTVSDTTNRARVVAREGSTQLPRLNRLQNLQPDTQISLGLLLDEAAKRGPDDIGLLFGDRVVRQKEIKHRVDSVVKGLISLGVRQGERVGVLMNARPSAFSVLAAISRLGATAVLLRPDGDRAVEARIGGISWLISDPELAVASAPLPGVTWCVLGGGTAPRTLPPHVIDMERIDPDAVVLPAWYRANPQRASDVAFVLFTGEGEGTKAMVISNRRWALSALGTASAAALKKSDTVYSVTPLYHSSALLMSLGGAIAGGARFALASGTDPDTFWDEVRRYGATHVSYTWTSLRAIAYGPEHPGENFHPIRLFIGSGMPRNLWRRVSDRFAPARVLEFYASTEGEAILANVAGSKPGSLGRALPGTAEVKVAAYDVGRRQLLIGADGLGRESAVDEIGLLVVRLDSHAPVHDVPLRSVFTRDDAWQSTGDLFARDEQGDLWLVDPIDSLILTEDGLVPPSWVRNALGTIPGVDLAVTYGVPDGEYEIVVGAVTMCADATLMKADLESAMRGLDPAQRPQYVQVVSEIPVTTWSRPLWRPLQDAGIPDPGKAEAVWRLAADGESYELLD